MNLRSIDLNLLVVLDALLDEAHVSRAAARVGLTQPAASAALDRCRHLFGDVLLERGRGLMRPTPKAESLRAPIKAILAAVAGLVDPAPVVVRDLRQAVRLVMADVPAIIAAGPLLAALAESAPSINLVVQPWHGAGAALDALARGSADLAVSVFPRADPAIRRKVLLQESYRVVCRPGHPAVGGFDLDTWLAYPHILVSGRGETTSPLDDQLAAMGRTRRVGAVVPSFSIVPSLLESSDMLAVLPSRCAALLGGRTFPSFEPPLPVEGFPLHLAWHMRRDSDPGTMHVAERIAAILA